MALDNVANTAQVTGQEHLDLADVRRRPDRAVASVGALIVLLPLRKVFLTPEEMRAWGWRIPLEHHWPSRPRRRRRFGRLVVQVDRSGERVMIAISLIVCV